MVAKVSVVPILRTLKKMYFGSFGSGLWVTLSMDVSVHTSTQTNAVKDNKYNTERI